MNDKQLLDLAIVWYDDAGALVIPRMAYSLFSSPKNSKESRVCTATLSPQQKVGKAPPLFFFPEGGGGLAQATVISHEKEKLVKFITYNM